MLVRSRLGEQLKTFVNHCMLQISVDDSVGEKEEVSEDPYW